MQKYELKRSITSVLCWLAYASIYTGRLNLSIASPLMQDSGIITPVGIGVMGSMFFYTYAFGQLFNGYLGDRFDPKRMVAIGLIFAAISNITIAFLPPFVLLLLLWAINGYAQSMLWGPTLRIVSNMYEPELRVRAAVVLSTSVAGGSVAGTALGLLMTSFGIKEIFLVPGFIMLCLGIVIFFFLPNNKNTANSEKKHISIKNIFLNKDIRSMIIPAASHGVVKDNINLWIPMYFVFTFNTDIKNAAIYIFIVPVISLAGRLLFPMLYNACGKNEKTASAVSFVLCAIMLIPLVFFNLPMYLVVILICITTAAISVINTAILSIYPLRFKESNNVSSVSGVMNFITYIGAGVSSTIFGVLISKFGFSYMIGVWVILSVVSAVALIKGYEEHKVTCEKASV